MPKTFKFFIWSGKKAVAFLVLTVVLSVAIVGSTLAYIFTQTDILKNIFEPATVDIDSNTDAKIIDNNSDVDVYIRAAVVVTWVNTSDGSILSTSPVENTDYVLSVVDGWTKGSDGFYYYTSKINPATKKITFLNNVTKNTTMDGYTLTVQVLSSAIQATPEKAVEQSWNVTIENGILSPPTTTP